MPTFDPFAAEPDTSFDPQQWAQSLTLPDFAAWEGELAGLVDAHFTPGARTGAEGSLTGKPAHDPDHERIVSVEVRRTRADVHTVLPDNGLDNHYTYRLAAADDGWRITKIVRTSAVPDAPLMPSTEVERLLAATDSAPPDEACPDEVVERTRRLFSGTFRVESLGTLTTSGVLTAHDFGWVRYDLAPFHRRVPAGAHPVDLARGPDGTNLALRVRFSDREPTARTTAHRVGRGDVVAVDAGNVAILDFPGLTSCALSRVEEL